MHDYTQDTLEQIRELTDLHAEVAIDDADYCKVLIGDCTVIESHFGKMPTLRIDGWDGATWTFGTVTDAAAAAEVIEDAHATLTSMAKQSVVAKMQSDTLAAFTANVLEVR